MGKKKKSGKKKIAAARLASIIATRCTGNRIVVMDSLNRSISELMGINVSSVLLRFSILLRKFSVGVSIIVLVNLCFKKSVVSKGSF